ncbi:MAG: hypothetical protein C0403_13225 [Desulfobacterium sp.]|nr:hypothetical protein [Desulfobacterium sp.]
MKIAFIHFHLKPGGVTTVIRQQINAIQNHCQVIALAGEKPAEFPTEVIPISGIAYDQKGVPSSSPENTASDIAKAIYNIWPDGCDVIHVHNPILAKNQNFLKVLKILQQKGFKLLLQIHDFAEDGRPLSYFPEPYPENCHYCVINKRDYDILTTSGLTKQGLHLLSNMVNPMDTEAPECSLENFVLYPVRAIRRKNIGEAILLSLFFQNGETLAITLPPNSPVDIQSYNGWKNFSIQHHIHIEFQASSMHDFSSLVRASKFIITTSINEGFGFLFLEPWTANKMLWGRNIPEICMDFQQKGIRLDNLYNQIQIPISWINREMLFRKFQSTLEQNLIFFGYTRDTPNHSNGFEDLIQNGCLDFGMLNEPFQQQVIARILSSSKDKNHLIAINPFLAEIGASGQQWIVDHNKKVILSNYNKALYQKKLLQIYEKVKHVQITHAIDRKKLLFHFLTPSRLNLLKWSVYEGS